VDVAFLAAVLYEPTQVRDAEIDGTPYAAKLGVVDEDDPALDEVEKDALEAVVPIEKR
jgi:hypothetical protein